MDTVITVIIILAVVSIVAIIIGLCIYFRNKICCFCGGMCKIIKESEFRECTCKMHGDQCSKSMRDYVLKIPKLNPDIGTTTTMTDKADRQKYSVKIFSSTAYNAKEGEILMKAAEDNASDIVRLYHIFEANGMTFFVMEYCATDLEAIVYIQELKVNKLKKYFRNIIRGLEYLHDEQGYVYFGLNPRDILISSGDNIRISNFESCLELNTPIENIEMSNMGEPPELRINGIFGFFTDSWDLGVLLIYACCKVYPDGQNTEELLKFFRDNNKSYYYDQQFTPILKEKLLQTDYEKRLWGKELPKAADDAQLIKCFGKTKFEVLKINLHY